MPIETILDAQTGEITVIDREYTPAQAAANAANAQREAERAAREAARAQKLEAVPANENSLPAIRDKVNQILEILRGEV